MKTSKHELLFKFSSSEHVSDSIRKIANTAEWKGELATSYTILPASTVVKLYERAKKGEAPERTVTLSDHLVRQFGNDKDSIPGSDRQPNGEDIASTTTEPLATLSADTMQTWSSEFTILISSPITKVVYYYR